jgi:hypothetical protein
MRKLLGILLLASSAFGQDYRRHNFHVDLGGAQPRGDLRTLFSNSFLAGFGYGYRFHEFFQADIGFDTVFGAAGVRDFLPSFVGNLRIRDYQHFLPFGGRVVVPVASERIRLYAGGGGAYLRYTERIRQPFGDSGLRFDCDVCSSRDGIGYYGMLGGDVALDSGQHFRVGAGVRVYRGETEGDPLGNVPARRTEDRWVNIFGRFSFSF